MRVTFIPPSESDFKKLFSLNKRVNGGGLSDIAVFNPSVRRGGGIFSTIARKVLPFLYKTVKPVAKEFGRAVATDVLMNGHSLKQSLKKRGVKALKKTGHKILSGSGGVKRNKNRQQKKKKNNLKRTIKDVYSLI